MGNFGSWAAPRARNGIKAGTPKNVNPCRDIAQSSPTRSPCHEESAHGQVKVCLFDPCGSYVALNGEPEVNFALQMVLRKANCPVGTAAFKGIMNNTCGVSHVMVLEDPPEVLWKVAPQSMGQVSTRLPSPHDSPTLTHGGRHWISLKL